MPQSTFPTDLRGRSLFMVGIKGTGMTALTELLCRRGAQVGGSDVAEHYYTDEILQALGVAPIVSFGAEMLPADVDVVIHSAAYDRRTHPQIVAAERRGVPIFGYGEALGAISRAVPALGVAGVHGKTTTCAMIGAMMRALDLPGTVLVGGAVSSLDNRSTWSGGDRVLVAETCEYRRHFLSFHPDAILLTAVEHDHPDYYRDYEEIAGAFVDYGLRLPRGGRLIYCADDAGACDVADRVVSRRRDIVPIQYGSGASNRYAIRESHQGAGASEFRLAGDRIDWRLRIPGRYAIVDAAGAIAAIDELLRLLPDVATVHRQRLREALEGFRGTRRRCEVVGEGDGVLVVDDYGHHPTAIRATLSGLRTFYPDRRLIVDFMSHTYSRTAALLDQFAEAFGEAAVVLVHKIYASPRERQRGVISGRDLADAIARRHPDVRYIDEPTDALEECLRLVEGRDLFVTMGAGDNWRLGRLLLERLYLREEASA